MYFTDHTYHSRADYLADIELIATNCEQYNGSEAQYTKFAKKMVEYAHSQLEEVSCLTTQTKDLLFNYSNTLS